MQTNINIASFLVHFTLVSKPNPLTSLHQQKLELCAVCSMLRSLACAVVRGFKDACAVHPHFFMVGDDWARFVDDADQLLAELISGAVLPRLRRNPGPLPIAGNFRMLLERLLDRLEAGDESDGSRVLHKTDEFVTIYDGFPQSRVHLLVLPRQVRVACLAEVRQEHLPVMMRLAAYVTWVMDELTSRNPDLSLTHGIHAVPTLRQLHVHILSWDFQAGLDKARRFNSFQQPFLVPLSAIVDCLAEEQSLIARFKLGTAEETAAEARTCLPPL